ncbi:sigma-70 family RNA polymerase sigma factor [Mycolicibacterium sp. XJ870]
MDDHDWLAARFEDNRPHLRSLAYRMLGSAEEAEDAVQEAWFRLSRTDSGAVENLGGWLTTVVARLCLNILQSRRSRPELSYDDAGLDHPAPVEGGGDPEHEALVADAIGPALLVVLDTLDPAERLAFVLHDMFAVPFDDIATVVGRSPAAARQLASRARRRVQGVSAPAGPAERQHEIVEAFLAASRTGDFAALLALLDPDVVLRADAAAVRMGATVVAHGPAAVAETFTGRAQGARLATIDGLPGLAWSVGGQVRVAFDFTVRDGVVAAIDLLADPDLLAELDLVFS